MSECSSNYAFRYGFSFSFPPCLDMCVCVKFRHWPVVNTKNPFEQLPKQDNFYFASASPQFFSRPPLFTLPPLANCLVVLVESVLRARQGRIETIYTQLIIDQYNPITTPNKLKGWVREGKGLYVSLSQRLDAEFDLIVSPNLNTFTGRSFSPSTKSQERPIFVFLLLRCFNLPLDIFSHLSLESLSPGDIGLQFIYYYYVPSFSVLLFS